MGSASISESVPTTVRRVVAVLIAATLLAVLAVAVRPSPAEAETKTGVIPSVCDSLIGPVPVDIPFVAANTPDAIEPGGTMSITLSGGFPEIVMITTYYVDWSEGTWPLPPQVETVDAVSFSASPGWSPPGAAAPGETGEWVAGDPLPAGLEVVENTDTEPGYVKVRFEGGPGTTTDPNTTGNISETPAITITVTVNEDDSDYYLEWRTFSLQLSSAETTFGTNNGPCEPNNFDQVLNGVTEVGSPEPTTTSTTTTTTTTVPPTTAAPTTTPATPRPPAATRPSYTG